MQVLIQIIFIFDFVNLYLFSWNLYPNAAQFWASKKFIVTGCVLLSF